MSTVFSLCGDLSHILTVCLLIWKIWTSGSCAGISGKSQFLLALVFTTRYLDLFYVFISVYMTSMKLIYICTSFFTCFLIYSKFKSTYNKDSDTLRVEFMIVPVAVLAVLFNHNFELFEILWTFSIYLESVAILPQLFMISKTGVVESYISYYVFGHFTYRALYILNWVYRYYYEDYFDIISVAAGCLQTVLYLHLWLDPLRHTSVQYVAKPQPQSAEPVPGPSCQDDQPGKSPSTMEKKLARFVDGDDSPADNKLPLMAMIDANQAKLKPSQSCSSEEQDGDSRSTPL